MSHSTLPPRVGKRRRRRTAKKAQPRTVALDRPNVPADFPLYPGARGRWRKKVRGMVCYFGRWADDRKGERAIKLWNEQKDDLFEGRTPQAKRDGLLLEGLAYDFMLKKKRQRDCREIKHVTFDDYYAATELLLKAVGKNRLVVPLPAKRS